MSSYLRQTPDSPVVHTGLFLCSSPSHWEWKAQGRCSCRGPHEARRVFARGSCHPCKLCWAALVGKQPFLSHRLYLLFLPCSAICYCFWFLSFLQVSWDHSWCHPNHHSSQPHDTAMAALCCFKESWEGSKILVTLQLKFLPEKRKQLLEALGYRNWWEAFGLLSDAGAALASQPRWHTLVQEPKLLLHTYYTHTCSLSSSEKIF